jgi:FkbM family methyltransferase
VRTIFEQDVEDGLRRAFFSDMDRGYFVEVGANHPEHLSQTFALEQRGWTGVLIEPQPDLAAELKRRRSAKVYAEGCSSRVNSGSRITLHLAGGASSFNKALNSAEIKPNGFIDVPVRTLDEILTDAGIPRVDFVSIDVEGHELEVLDGFDLALWRPRLILIEDFLLHLSVHRYLTRRGYRWFRRTGIDNWYVPANKSPRLGALGLWQFINKFYLGTPLRRIRFAWRRLTTVPKSHNQS